MRTISTKEITKNIKEMCIEANLELSQDVKEKLCDAAQKETKELGKQIPASFSAFGAVSLLSDIMDMSNDFNRQIYKKAMDLEFLL